MASYATDPVALLQALIRCPSVTPVDEGALGVLEDVLKPMGFACERMPFTQAGTPDVDNLAKLPLDAANGLLWKDDAQVVELRALKRRPAAGEAEHTRVTVEVLS